MHEQRRIYFVIKFLDTDKFYRYQAGLKNQEVDLIGLASQFNALSGAEKEIAFAQKSERRWRTVFKNSSTSTYNPKYLLEFRPFEIICIEEITITKQLK